MNVNLFLATDPYIQSILERIDYLKRKKLLTLNEELSLTEEINARLHHLYLIESRNTFREDNNNNNVTNGAGGIAFIDNTPVPIQFSPTDIPNLLMWLNPTSGMYTDNGTTIARSGELVYQWKDASGNGNHATQSAITNRALCGTDGLLCIPWVSASAYYSIPTAPINSRNFSLFCVFRPCSEYSNQSIFQANGLNPSILSIDNIGGSGIGKVGYYDGTARFDVTPKRSPATLQVQYLIGSSSAAIFGLNENSSSVSALASAAVTGSLIGRFNGSRYFQGEIREILLYNRSITPSESIRIKSYLYTKHGIGTAVYTKQLIYDGDSLTKGWGSSNASSYPYFLSNILDNTWRHINYGLESQTLTTIVANAAANIDILYNVGYTKNVVVVWGGSNDLDDYQRTAAQVYGDLVTYCNARRSAGFKVVVLSVIARSTMTEAMNTHRLNYNTSASVNWNTFADGFADVANDSRLSNFNDTTYFYDGIHLTNAGYSIVAGIVKTAVDGIV